MRFEERPEWKKGHEGEALVARLMIETGWGVVKTYNAGVDDDGGSCAPKLYQKTGDIILPDLDVFADGLRIWCEVKTKDAPVWYTKRCDYRHGYSHRHHEAYLEIEKTTSTPVMIFIYEVMRSNVICAMAKEIDKFGARGEGRARFGYDPSRMIYFPRAAFRLWATVGDGEMFRFENESWVTNEAMRRSGLIGKDR